jgi:hypothetical protein
MVGSELALIIYEGYHIGVLRNIHVSLNWSCLNSPFDLHHRYAAKISDPWLGPKGVRWLLALRGFSGYALSEL